MATNGGLGGILRATTALLLSLLCTSCTISRVLYYNVPDRFAASHFEERVVAASSHPRPFERAGAETDFPIRSSKTRAYDSFESLIAKNHTNALLVLQHDVVVYERYFDGVTAETRMPGFSMTKTFAAVAVGCAEQDGLIASSGDRLVAYVPALASKPGYGKITIDHLLRMTSGINYEEESLAGAMLYYTEDLRSQAHAYDVKWEAGTHYEYGSIHGQLLWEVLSGRLHGKTVSRYFQDRLWDAIGAERAATWSLDSAEHGVEKFSAGFNATTRDYARLGVLFQHRGEAGDQRVLPAQWVEDSIAYDDVAGLVHTSDGAVRRGHYQWFRTTDGCCYFAKGYNGQYIFVDRPLDVVIVRLGDGYGDVDWTKLFIHMAQSLPARPTTDHPKPPPPAPPPAMQPSPPLPVEPPPTKRPPPPKPKRVDQVAATEIAGPRARLAP
jgi:CubicO group peptidase (beta-lactamase class C family)